MDEVYLSVYDRVHVVFDVLRVGGDDGAVVVIVCVFKFIPFIRNGRIEDVFDAFIDQPLYMPMSQLRRIALGFTRDGLNTQLVDLPCEAGESTTRKPNFVKNVNQNG